MSDLHKLLPTVSGWLAADKRVAAATVVQTWKSAPRRPGAKLFVTDTLDVIGSVSAGCVEAAVIEAAQTVIQGGAPQMLHFGISDSDSFEVGLACGGEIDIFVERWKPTFHDTVVTLVEQREPFEVITTLADASHTILRHGGWTEETVTYQPERGLFAQRVSPPPRLVIVGGNHIGLALCQLTAVLGWDVIVVDPRPTFANWERFPTAHAILNTYPDHALPALRPDAQTAVVVLTHDPKFDDPALQAALNSDAGYIGALGSRRTQTQHQQHLLHMGFTHTDIDRIHGPIGLAIGAATPEQIALAILAEIVACFQDAIKDDVKIRA